MFKIKKIALFLLYVFGSVFIFASVTAMIFFEHGRTFSFLSFLPGHKYGIAP